MDFGNCQNLYCWARYYDPPGMLDGNLVRRAFVVETLSCPNLHCSPHRKSPRRLPTNNSSTWRSLSIVHGYSAVSIPYMPSLTIGQKASSVLAWKYSADNERLGHVSLACDMNSTAEHINTRHSAIERNWTFSKNKKNVFDVDAASSALSIFWVIKELLKCSSEPYLKMMDHGLPVKQIKTFMVLESVVGVDAY